MKPASPLSLVLFLSLTAASPLPISFRATQDCRHYTPCTHWLRDIFSSRSSFNNRINDHTPPTRLSSPHFPAHQPPQSSSPESHREIEAEFNNSPVSPPQDETPSMALSGTRPLKSSYLLSLANPALQNPPQGEPQSTSTSDSLPSKPTSALPILREEDTVRYWATRITDSPNLAEKKGGPKVVVSHAAIHLPKCGNLGKIPGSTYLRVGKSIVIAREYSDLLVVGMVVLFLAAVVVSEALEYFGDLSSTMPGGRRRQRRGEIFLGDNEGVQWALERPSRLQPTPAPKFKTPLLPVREVELNSEKGECYHD